MNNLENLCFKTKSLGKLKILAFIGENALLEKMYNTPEKYIVASGFDMESKSWNYGSYYQELEDALKKFYDKTENQIIAKKLVEREENQEKTISTNDIFKRIYQELKEQINNQDGKKFIKEYYIPSINNSFEDKTVNDHYFVSGIEMELENMMSKFDYKIKYARYKDKYFFSNDENVAQLQANKEIRKEYAKKIDELGYDRKEYGVEEEM
jgi:uncharacterized membrane protein YheB (UPF0754 family)